MNICGDDAGVKFGLLGVLPRSCLPALVIYPHLLYEITFIIPKGFKEWFIYYFMFLGVLPACIFVWECQIPCNWSYRQLCVAMGVLGINPGSSRRAPSVLNHWAIFPALSFLFFSFVSSSFLFLVFLFFLLRLFNEIISKDRLAYLFWTLESLYIDKVSKL